MSAAPKHGPARGYTVTTTAQKYLNEHPGRRGLFIQNNGTAAILIGFGAAPTAANSIQLAAGQTFQPPVAPADAIWLAATTATQAVVVSEG